MQFLHMNHIKKIFNLSSEKPGDKTIILYAYLKFRKEKILNTNHVSEYMGSHHNQPQNNTSLAQLIRRMQQFETNIFPIGSTVRILN